MCIIVVGVIFLCVWAGAASGGGYSYPQPPLQFDEGPTSPAPIYLPAPPPQDDVPQVIPIPTYLPPAYPPLGAPPVQDEILPPFLDDTVVIPSGDFFPQTQKQAPLQILNMSCLDARDGSGHFRTFLRAGLQSRGFPVVESASDCAVTAVGADVYRIDLEGQRMADCGIRSCGIRMCLVLRMAMVPGLRVAEDSLVTLQCTPQETVVSHTKHIRLVAQNEQGRANVRSIPIASGGNQRKFEFVVTLLRKNNGVFDQPIQQGSSVRLGDELLLKTSVRDGSGWKSSRMGSVIIRSTSSQRSVVLVDEHGCRNPTITTICPQQPQQLTPLSLQFPFRAFLFQGAAPADDLLLSVRMSACLRPRDCYQSRICEENGRARVSRAVFNVSEDSVTDWESQLKFRVLPKELPEARKSPGWAVVCLSALSVALACSVVVLVVKPVKQRIYL